MDLFLLHKINQVWQTAFLDWLLPVVSAFPVWTPVFALVLAVYVWKNRWFKPVATILVIGITIGVGDGLIARTMKDKIGRQRPHQSVYGLTVRDAADVTPRVLAVFYPPETKPTDPKPVHRQGASFPSAHVVNTFSASTALIVLFGRRFTWTLLIAATVAYSRVYTASHWPSDIPPSILIGLANGTVTPLACNALWQRLAPRLAPGLAAAHPTLLSRPPRRAGPTSISDANTISPAQQ